RDDVAARPGDRGVEMVDRLAPALAARFAARAQALELEVQRGEVALELLQAAAGGALARLRLGEARRQPADFVVHARDDALELGDGGGLLALLGGDFAVVAEAEGAEGLLQGAGAGGAERGAACHADGKNHTDHESKRRDVALTLRRGRSFCGCHDWALTHATDAFPMGRHETLANSLKATTRRMTSPVPQTTRTS